MGLTTTGQAQLLQRRKNFMKADSGVRAYNVLHYDLEVQVDPDRRYIWGFNAIRFKPDRSLPLAQVDLSADMQVDSIVMRNRKLSYRRVKNAVFVEFPKALSPDKRYTLRFYYSGHPRAARNPPWDGGFIWKRDKNGRPWVGVMVQGMGASLWWPSKDSWADEPDRGMSIKVAAPDGLMEISNGKFKGKRDLGNGYTQWHWRVSYPINHYDVTLNIGDYSHFGERYRGLRLDYYPLRYNLKKARAQFEQVEPMLDCFQHKFGAYPFKRDGYKLVESFGLGMEHQSAIAYGNRYEMGYLGRDLSGTGIGLRFDFIIVHETAHEWFGNSITASNIADMWIHEAFATYGESVYVGCRWGDKAAQRYLNGLQRRVKNDRPIVGDYNREGSGDMYDKGALMLNTLRHVIDDDLSWWKLIRDFAIAYRYQIIDGKAVVEFFNERSKRDLTPIFDEYLKYTEIPTLELRREGTALAYRWRAEAAGFAMPIDVRIGNRIRRLKPTQAWQTLGNLSPSQVEPLTTSFYIRVKRD